MLFIKKYLFFSVMFSLLSFFFLSSAPFVRADSTLLNGQTGMEDVGNVYGGQTPADIRVTAAKIINIVLEFLGIIFLGLTIYAGFLYMTAGGNEENTQKAKDMLRNAIIGLIIILSAWAITRFSIVIMNKTVGNAADYQDYLPYY